MGFQQSVQARLHSIEYNQGQIQTYEKGVTSRPVIIVDIGLAGIFIHSQYAKHASTRGSGGMPPRNFEKQLPSKIESEGIFSNLSTFYVPVDKGTKNFLKCIICMPIHAG